MCNGIQSARKSWWEHFPCRGAIQFELLKPQIRVCQTVLNSTLWEQPLKFTKTYYVDNQHAKADDHGPGTQARPFRTISQAAEVLQPGERVVIASGTYRECVRPARGGTSPAQMISYEAAPGAKVVIKGSEVIKDGWVQETIPVGFPGSAQGAPGNGVTAWRYEFKSSMFPDTYNPFALPSLMGEWVWLDTRNVDIGPYVRRRGLVFADGKPLEPVEQQRELAARAFPARTRFQGASPAAKWITGPPARWTDHAGGWRFSERSLLGG